MPSLNSHTGLDEFCIGEGQLAQEVQHIVQQNLSYLMTGPIPGQMPPSTLQVVDRHRSARSSHTGTRTAGNKPYRWLSMQLSWHFTDRPPFSKFKFKGNRTTLPSLTSTAIIPGSNALAN